LFKVQAGVPEPAINQMTLMTALVAIICLLAVLGFRPLLFEINRRGRREYYRNNYLKSDAWQRKRYVVLRRDNWRCVYCGGASYPGAPQEIRQNKHWAGANPLAGVGLQKLS
jgi:hypothetical protein